MDGQKFSVDTMIGVDKRWWKHHSKKGGVLDKMVCTLCGLKDLSSEEMAKDKKNDDFVLYWHETLASKGTVPDGAGAICPDCYEEEWEKKEVNSNEKHNKGCTSSSMRKSSRRKKPRDPAKANLDAGSAP